MNFSDLSSYEPTAWSWSFPGGTPSSSTDRNPAGVTYASPGTYDVRLVARNSSGADTLVRSCAVTVTPSVSVREGGSTPAGLSLSQNYPNPFNPSSVIRFSVQTEARVRLAVYDLLGREVRVLVDGVVGPGERSVAFDGAGLPSGAYVCRLEAGGMTIHRRMMLVR